MRWTFDDGSLPTRRSRYRLRPPSDDVSPVSSATNAGRSAVSVGETQVVGSPPASGVSVYGDSLSMHLVARSRKMSSVLLRVSVPGA